VWLAPSVNNVIVVIALTRWTTIARLARAEFLRLRTADFVSAAISAGASAPRIIVRHVLPAALAPVMVAAVFGVADAILIEAGLSWLGIGVPVAEPSWGHLLRNAFDQLRSAGFLVYPPCVAIFAAIFSCHLLADGLRENWEPRAQVGA
jgi:peptide/nickel transport system permease protein